LGLHRYEAAFLNIEKDSLWGGVQTITTYISCNRTACAIYLTEKKLASP
jgi:hypothetical protein